MRFRTWQNFWILYALLLASIVMYANKHFYSDDAYITLRYAKNYLDGFGIVWNPGEYLQGYTNFLHLIFISFLGKIGIDLFSASRLIGIAAYIGLLMVMFRFRIFFKKDSKDFFWHLPIIFVATSIPMIVWSIGGLEGTLFSLLVAEGCFLFLIAAESPTKYRFYFASGIVSAFGFLTRPDGIVFIVVSVIWLLWMRWKKQSQNCMNVIVYSAGATIVAIPYVIWQIFYYGDIVPNTFYAKAGAPFLLKLNIGLHYVVNYLLCSSFLPVLLFVVIVYHYSKPLLHPTLSYLALLISAYVTFIVLAGGDHMPLFRFMLPVIPLMSVMLTMALSFNTNANLKNTASIMTIAILIFTTLQTIIEIIHPEEDPASLYGTMMGKYIATAWPTGSLIALNTAGSTPYYASRNRFIDMLGLNDAIIAKRKIEKISVKWQRMPGHLKGDGAYVVSRHPDYIIVGPAHGTSTSHPWFLSDLELSQNSQFKKEYALFNVMLDSSGRQVSSGGKTFMYYKRV